MRKQYHILNGDALKEFFPESLQGNIIIARECLLDGNVNGKDLDALYASRAKFLSQNYGGTEQDYYLKTVPEFQKILNINDDSDVNLWFEDDLFCQVNFWFVTYLLTQNFRNNKVYLIRPDSHSQYGFGALNQAELLSIYEDRLILKEMDKIASLWVLYQKGDNSMFLHTARELEPLYPFIITAAKAHIERVPGGGSAGRPIDSLRAIMRDLKTEEFGPVFREFNKRESIYGFGDIQVKRLLDEIVKEDRDD